MTARTMTWLPMSEAPRDGGRIVVWYIEDREWICVVWVGQKWREIGTGYFYGDDELSHWLRIDSPH